MEPARDVIDYYERFAEESRLAAGASRLEFERTKEILQRLLPTPPARIVDVGGAAGVYSAWLAGLGYEVHLVDASERLVGEARKRQRDPDQADRVVGGRGRAPACRSPTASPTWCW